MENFIFCAVPFNKTPNRYTIRVTILSSTKKAKWKDATRYSVVLPDYEFVLECTK